MDEDLVRRDGFQMDWRRAGEGARLDPGRDMERFALYCLLDVDEPDSDGVILSRGDGAVRLGMGASVFLAPGVASPFVLGPGAGFLKVTVPR